MSESYGGTSRGTQLSQPDQLKVSSLHWHWIIMIAQSLYTCRRLKDPSGHTPRIRIESTKYLALGRLV